MSSLLALMLLATGGQAACAQQAAARPAEPRHNVWMDAVVGPRATFRHGRYSLSLHDGVSGVIGSNFVDGFRLAPHLTWGVLLPDSSRLELEEHAGWAFSRRRVFGQATLRYLRPTGLVCELSGGQAATDFNVHTMMQPTMVSLTTGLFAWSHYKFLIRTWGEVRLTMPLDEGRRKTLSVWGGWTQRQQTDNHRRTSFFGVRPQDNTPRLHVPGSASDMMRYDGPVDARLWQLGARMAWPAVALTGEGGWGHYAGGNPHKADSHFRFLRLGIETQTRRLTGRADDVLDLYATVGTTLRHGTLGLADWRHTHASRFWWHRPRHGLHSFAMLDDYELSTDGWWAEAHAEWSSRDFLLSRVAGGLREYLQLRALCVATPSAYADLPGAHTVSRLHWETAYGWQLDKDLRLAVNVGFDNLTCRKASFSFITYIK